MRHQLAPLACELEGTRKPWTGLSIQEVQDLFKRVFPQYHYVPQEKDAVWDVVSRHTSPLLLLLTIVLSPL